MKEEIVQYFTEDEENFVNLLVEIGMKKTVAVVLVFFTGASQATSREIERGTDLRQPEVSIALKYLTDRDWITHSEDSLTGKGRPVKYYTRTKPVPVILNEIEKEVKTESDNQIERIRKMRDSLS